jgi:hypothetical protein
VPDLLQADSMTRGGSLDILVNSCFPLFDTSNYHVNLLGPESVAKRPLRTGQLQRGKCLKSSSPRSLVSEVYLLNS